MQKLAATLRSDPMSAVRWAAIVPAILLTLLFFVLPMARLLQISFFRNIQGALMEPDFTTENYVRFLGDSFFLARMGQTFFYGFIVTAACLVLGFPLAYTLVRTRIPGRTFLLGIVLYPILTNALVLVFAWLVILGNLGPVNQLAALILPDIGTIRMVGTPSAVLIGMMHAALPFMIIPLMAAISNIPPSQEDAAASLGASRARIMWEIVVPLSMPGVLGGALLSFTTVLSGFLFPLYLGGNTTNIMPQLIYEAVSIAANWPFGAAMTFITLMLTLMLVGVIASGVGVARRLSRASVR